MRIVLDENLPRPLVRIFGPGHQVVTVPELGFAGMANGALLARLEGNSEVFVTADKNLRYQLIRVEVMRTLTRPVGHLPTIGDRLP